MIPASADSPTKRSKQRSAILIKERWTLITDPVEQEALTTFGKWNENKPTTVMRGDQMWVLVNEQISTWRENRSGKRL